jgi:hypothetical protein
VHQSEHYNGHYKMHDRTTHLLIDYDSYIIAFVTMIPGHCNDELIAVYNKLFRKIIGHDFALDDPGFQGCGYIITGYCSSTVNTFGQEVFTIITKREQQLIENVNSYIKQCCSIDKEHVFIHLEAHLLACIYIAVGLYNLKREWGYYRGNK